MAGLEELVGADVILVHRLLKNAVTAATGIDGLCAVHATPPSSAAGIDPVAQGLREHHEETDVAGDVRAWIRDLGPVWQAFLDQPRPEIHPRRSAGPGSSRLPVPVPVAWEYITSPIRRPMWTTGVTRDHRDVARRPSRHRHDEPLHARQGRRRSSASSTGSHRTYWLVSVVPARGDGRDRHPDERRADRARERRDPRDAAGGSAGGRRSERRSRPWPPGSEACSRRWATG